MAIAIMLAAWTARASADEALCRDPAVNGMVNQALRDALDPNKLADLYRGLNRQSGGSPPDCSGTAVYCVGLKAALASVDRAYALLREAEPDLVGARAALSAGRAYGAPWQLLATEGDVTAALAHRNKDPDLFRTAAADLQSALNAIAEPPLCAAYAEIRPEPDEAQRIRKRAQEAVMLSPRFDLSRTKKGDCGGIFLETRRGIDVEAIPMPITFAYDKADFTPEGQKAADALLLCLREKNLPSIVLTGHTDAHGSDSYNMDLSARRLATVQAFLKAGGYTGSLRLVPMGKREAFQPDDPTQHSPDEIDQMNRRVELRETKP